MTPSHPIPGRLRSLLQRWSGGGFGARFTRLLVGSAGLRILGMACGFLVGVQLARGLSAEGYGIYGIAMSVIATLAIPVELGLPQLLTREVAAAFARSDWGRIHAVISWGRRVVLVMAVLVTGTAMAWLHLSGRGLGSPLGATLLAGLVMVPLVALNNLQGASLRGLQRIIQGQFPDALVRPALFAGLLFLVPSFAGGGALTSAVAMALGAASAAFACFITTAQLRKVVALEDAALKQPIDSRGWFGSAVPMALTEGMRVLQGHLMTLLLGVLSTAAVVGIFRVAVSIAQMIAVCITILNIVGSPLISHAYSVGDLHRVQRLMRWIAGGMVLSTGILSAPFLVLGSDLLGFVFGQEFEAAAPALAILCVGWVVNGAFGGPAVLLNMTGQERRVTRASVLSLVVLLVLGPGAITLYGAEGAAVASVLALWLWTVLMWRDCRQILGLETSIFLASRHMELNRPLSAAPSPSAGPDGAESLAAGTD